MLERRSMRRGIRYRMQATLIGIAALLTAACDEPSPATAPAKKAAVPDPHFTAGQGSSPAFIGQGTYADFGKVEKSINNWNIELAATGGLEVVVRSFTYDAGAFTGWHKHPGPVLIQVIKGTVTFFEADDPCTPIVVTEGQGYVDDGNGHIGRNLTDLHAQDVTIYLAPPGTQVSQLRIDMDAPPGAEHCP